MKNFCERIVSDRLEHDMDVVRHDRPGEQVVPQAIELLQRIRNHQGNCRIPKKTLARSCIQRFFYPARMKLPLPPSLTRGQRAAHLGGRRDDIRALRH